MSSLKTFEKYVDLPPELRMCMLLYCDYRTLRKYCMVSKALRREVKECGLFWESFTRRDFGELYELYEFEETFKTLAVPCEIKYIEKDWRETYFFYMKKTSMELFGHSRTGNKEKVNEILKVIPDVDIKINRDNVEFLQRNVWINIDSQGNATHWTASGLQSSFGWTALMMAASAGNIYIVRKLLKNGASPNTKSPSGYVPLIEATFKGDIEIVRELLEGGANPNIVGKNGKTALIVATETYHPSIVKMLLEARADPNLPDEKGDTPLHYSSRMGMDGKTALLLYEWGADLYRENNDGDTALDIAEQTFPPDVVERIKNILESHPRR